MIFVTVGAQMPFDRFIRAVDTWAAQCGRSDIFAQIGPQAWKPRHIEWTKFLAPDDHRRRVEGAVMIVAHAGMGSIITALEYGKPILVMPRRGDLGETRNDHQVATARRFHERGLVSVALDEKELSGLLTGLGELRRSPRISAHASPELLANLRDFLCGVQPAYAGRIHHARR